MTSRLEAIQHDVHWALEDDADGTVELPAAWVAELLDVARAARRVPPETNCRHNGREIPRCKCEWCELDQALAALDTEATS